MRAGRTIRWARAVCLIALVPAMLLGGGCRKPSRSEHPEAKPVTKSAERGPVKVTVAVDKDQITIAEKLTMTIVTEAAAGVDVTMPQFGDKLSEFQIRNYRDVPAVDNGRQRRWEQTYDLDIFLSGEYTIPPVTVKFTDARKTADDPSAKPIESDVSTEAIPIKVASLLEGQFDPTKFRDIKGPVGLPADPTRVWLWRTAGVLGGAAVLAGLGFWLVRRRRRPSRLSAQAPHEWAFDQLRALIDDQWIEQGRVQDFFYRLSEITRVYIELRFGLMAPERTTEEFLAEAQSSALLSPAQKRLLDDFLHACDLVKFARHEPPAEEIERAFGSARDFIDQTRPSVASAEAAA